MRRLGREHTREGQLETTAGLQGVMDGVPASRGYRGGFSAALMLKDLHLAAATAETCAAPLHMSRTAEQLYRQVIQCRSGVSKRFVTKLNSANKVLCVDMAVHAGRSGG